MSTFSAKSAFISVAKALLTFPTWKKVFLSQTQVKAHLSRPSFMNREITAESCRKTHLFMLHGHRSCLCSRKCIPHRLKAGFGWRELRWQEVKTLQDPRRKSRHFPAGKRMRRSEGKILRQNSRTSTLRARQTDHSPGSLCSSSEKPTTKMYYWQKLYTES